MLPSCLPRAARGVGAEHAVVLTFQQVLLPVPTWVPGLLAPQEGWPALARDPQPTLLGLLLTQGGAHSLPVPICVSSLSNHSLPPVDQLWPRASQSASHRPAGFSLTRSKESWNSRLGVARRPPCNHLPHSALGWFSELPYSFFVANLLQRVTSILYQTFLYKLHVGM